MPRVGADRKLRLARGTGLGQETEPAGRFQADLGGVRALIARAVAIGRAPVAGVRRGAIARIAAVLALTASCPFSAASGPPPRPALKIGVSVALTGPSARWGVSIRHGVEMAVEDVNRRGGAGGHTFEAVVADSVDPARPGLEGLASYERLVADPSVIAVVGPQTSQGGRAVAALLSSANLATITPSATTFDITDPALTDRFRPGGRASYFRAIGTDLTQGDAMARFAHATLGVRRVILIDDGIPFGMRMVDAFARRATSLGITVLDRWRLGWLRPDYREELRWLGSLRPDALYAGVRYEVGVKLARQIPEIMPSIHMLGPESLYNSAFPIQAFATGAEGWFVSNVGPDPTASAPGWAERFRIRFGRPPTTYSVTAYTAATVIAEAVGRVVTRGSPITRETVRDAIAATRLPDALSGPLSFDSDGDLERPTVSIYQVRGGAFYHVATILSTNVKFGAVSESRP